MYWLKLDSDFYSDPKVVQLRIEMGPAACWIYVCLLGALAENVKNDSQIITIHDSTFCTRCGIRHKTYLDFLSYASRIFDFKYRVIKHDAKLSESTIVDKSVDNSHEIVDNFFDTLPQLVSNSFQTQVLYPKFLKKQGNFFLIKKKEKEKKEEVVTKNTKLIKLRKEIAVASNDTGVPIHIVDILKNKFNIE